MNITFPHVIENGLGEKIVFSGIVKEADGDKLVGENFVSPGVGPVMHTHWLQDEGFTVLSGRIAYQVQGQPVHYATEGESVVFKRGVPHRFWNAGDDILHCSAWLKPANTFPFFITAIFEAQKKSGRAEPSKFDGAFLLMRYSSEYELVLPKFVKKIIIPVTYFIGKVLGKYKHFENAPGPVRN